MLFRSQQECVHPRLPRKASGLGREAAAELARYEGLVPPAGQIIAQIAE